MSDSAQLGAGRAGLALLVLLVIGGGVAAAASAKRGFHVPTDPHAISPALEPVTVFGILRPESPRSEIWKKSQLATLGLEDVYAAWSGVRPEADEKGEPVKPLTCAERLTLAQSLVARPAEEVRDLVRRKAGEGANLEERNTALQLLAATGDEAHFALVVEIAKNFAESSMAHPSGGASYAEALRATWPSSEHDLLSLRSAFVKMPRATVERTIDAVSACGDQNALGVLIDWLGFKYDRAILNALTSFSPLALIPHADDLDERLRAGLESSRWKHRCAVIRVIVRLRRVDLLEELIAQLEHDHPRVVHASLRALRKLSGRRYPAEFDAWDTWYTLEVEHIERLRGLEPELIEAAESVEFIRWLKHLEKHPTAAESGVEVLRAALRSDDAGVRSIALRVASGVLMAETLPELVEIASSEKPGAARASLIVPRLAGTLLGSCHSDWTDNIGRYALD